LEGSYLVNNMEKCKGNGGGMPGAGHIILFLKAVP
jgi:hypothetical protein